MSGEAVAERVRMNAFGDTGAPGGGAAGMPDYLVRDGLVRTACLQAGKEPAVATLQRAVVSAQLVEQFRTERNLAVLAAFALANADHHPMLVDIFGPQLAQLGAAHAGGIECHQDGAMSKVRCGVNKTGHFIRAEHDGHLSAQHLGER